ncbi:MAG TPA: hypothetical protein VGM54_25410 [Chthoniobacter sp.]|jgi:hypothetical protein
MKRTILIPVVLASTMFFTGCASMLFDAVTGSTCRTDSRCGSYSSGGIDPVTMAGIEASQRATDEMVQQQTQWGIDQANAASAQAGMDAANAASAQAGADAAASAAAAAAQFQ